MNIKNLSAAVFVLTVFLALCGALPALAATSLPDFKLKEITFESGGYLPTASVQNIGSAAAPASAQAPVQIIFYWLDEDGKILGGGVKTQLTSSISPGGVMKTAMPFPAGQMPPAGTKKVMAAVDADEKGFGIIAEENENNNAIKATIPLVDLSVTFKTSAGSTEIMPRVKNSGTIAIQGTSEHPITILCEWEDVDMEPIGEKTGSSFSDQLDPGEALNAPCAYAPGPHPAGAVWMTVTADKNLAGKEFFFESNESNNAGSFQLFLPDLAVSAIAFDQQTKRPTVTIKNKGWSGAMGTFANPIPLGYAWGDGNGGFVPAGQKEYATMPVASLIAKDGILPVVVETIPPTGAVRFYVWVDLPKGNAWGAVAETNETNNVFSAVLPGQPDLTITSVSFDPVTAVPTAIIKNAGDTDAKGINGVPVPVMFRWYNAENKPVGDYLVSAYADGIKAGAELSVALPGANPPAIPLPPAGAVKIVVTADQSLAYPGGVVAEANEKNNTFEAAPPHPDLVVDSVSFAPQTFVPTVTVKNIGSKSAEISPAKPMDVAVMWMNEKNEVVSVKALEYVGKFSGSLLPQASAAVLVGDKSGESFPPKGAVKVFIAVDKSFANLKGVVAEANEENNTKEQFLPIAGITGKLMAQGDKLMKLEDLGAEKARVLPDSPLHALKLFGQNVQMFLAFSDENKAETSLQFMNAKMGEISELAAGGKAEKAAQYLSEYNKETERAAGLIKELAKKDPARADQLTAKALKFQLKHQEAIAALGENIPPATAETLKTEKAKALQRVTENIKAIGDSERIEKIIGDAALSTGSPLKPLRQIAVLEAVKASAPPVAREGISRAIDNATGKLGENISRLTPEEMKAVPAYVESVGENGRGYVRALDAASEQVPEASRETLRMNIDTVSPARQRPAEQRRQAPPSTERNPTELRREEEVVPRERGAAEETVQPQPRSETPASAGCNRDYVPVCGEDRRTYTNRCIAERESNVSVSYEGVCRDEAAPPR